VAGGLTVFGGITMHEALNGGDIINTIIIMEALMACVY